MADDEFAGRDTTGRDASDLDAFLRTAGAILGSERVTTPDALAGSAQRATFPWPGRILGCLRPADAESVPPLLAAATRHRVPIHPVSRGRSWGLGSRLPPRDAVLLDLGDLDRILGIDMRRGTARIEPGVTFAALQRRLAHEGLAFHLPSFGGPTDASVLANALERGEGAGPFGDRFGALWDIDLALATGERFSTGADRHAEPARAIHPRPAGPVLEGLFSQSGFGIALAGTIALQPTLPHALALVAEIGGHDALPGAIATLARLIHAGIVPAHSVAVWNGAKRRASLPAAAARDLSEGLSTDTTADDDFALSVMLTAAHPDLLRILRSIVEAELRPVTSAISVHDDRDASGRRLDTQLTGFSDGRNVLSVYAGKPVKPDVPGNPDADGCGFLWLCPVVPLDGTAVAAVAGDVDQVMQEFRNGGQRFLHPALGFQAVSARAFHAYVSLAWDRDAPGADALAMRAHDALVARFAARGFTPYRLALATISAFATPEDASAPVIARLRAALDPEGILSPGKCGAGHAKPGSGSP
ncbi:MAG: FAD-binding oxidoreductase [Salinarimonas sp.]|nr:FAD-binding oxidoreductase [Salinarimonas sp.]